MISKPLSPLPVSWLCIERTHDLYLGPMRVLIYLLEDKFSTAIQVRGRIWTDARKQLTKHSKNPDKNKITKVTKLEKAYFLSHTHADICTHSLKYIKISISHISLNSLFSHQRKSVNGRRKKVVSSSYVILLAKRFCLLTLIMKSRIGSIRGTSSTMMLPDKRVIIYVDSIVLVTTLDASPCPDSRTNLTEEQIVKHTVEEMKVKVFEDVLATTTTNL